MAQNNTVKITLPDGTEGFLPPYMEIVQTLPKYLILKAGAGDQVAAVKLMLGCIDALDEGVVKEFLTTTAGDEFTEIFSQWTEGISEGK